MLSQGTCLRERNEMTLTKEEILKLKEQIDQSRIALSLLDLMLLMTDFKKKEERACKSGAHASDRRCGEKRSSGE